VERTSRALGAAARDYGQAHGRHERRAASPGGASPRLRWSVTPRTAAVASVAVLLLAGGVALHAARGAAGDPVVLPTPDAPGPSSGSPVHVSTVVVDVVGEVVAPGVVRLPTGSRVADAVAAAGGATADAQLDAINLARVLVDGEQIVVPRPGEPAPQVSSGGTPGSPSGSALVDLNTADAATLDTLPGVGPVIAQRIVDARAKHPFSSVDELADVPGIGPALLAKLRPLVRT
jgi:competence protein ComEA